MVPVVATGVTSEDNREILACDATTPRARGFWQQFLGSLRDSGLTGVRLVISDAHQLAVGGWHPQLDACTLTPEPLQRIPAPPRTAAPTPGSR